MPVVGLSISNITAKRSADMFGPAQVGNNVNLKSVEETEMAAIGKKGLKVGFEFTTSYTDDKKKALGEIAMTGEVFFMADNPAELLSGWKKEKKLPEDVTIQCINTVMKRCMSKALALSEDVNLPPPVPIPFAQKQSAQDEKSRYIG